MSPSNRRQYHAMMAHLHKPRKSLQSATRNRNSEWVWKSPSCKYAKKGRHFIQSEIVNVLSQSFGEFMGSMISFGAPVFFHLALQWPVPRETRSNAHAHGSPLSIAQGVIRCHWRFFFLFRPARPLVLLRLEPLLCPWDRVVDSFWAWEVAWASVSEGRCLQ